MSVIEAIRAGDETKARELAASDPQASRQRDDNGTPATLLALYHGQPELARALLPPDEQLDVFEAASFGRTERLRELLDEDPDAANAYAGDGFQPLGLACFFGHVDAARLLVERGADVNSFARNEHIKTAPLHAAAASVGGEKDEAARYELCKLLLEHGAEANLPQESGFTALDAARQNGDERIEQLLREHGATG